MKLADKFRLFVYLFDKRPDVDTRTFEVYEDEGMTAKERQPFGGVVPADILEFYAVYPEVEYSYEINTLEDHGGSGHGGKLLLDRLSPGSRTSKWWESFGYEPIDFEESFMVENINDEWTVQYARQDGEDRTEARLVVFSSGSDHVRWWDTFEDYVTDGAKNAFVWMWQQGDAYWEVEALLGALLDNSVAAETPRAELRQLLIEQADQIDDGVKEYVPGLDVTEEVADDLIDWLGERVVLLVPN